MDELTTKTLLPELLKNNVATVTFTKKDGTERVMKCTLKPDMLPPQVVNEDKPAKQKSETSIAVYDLEINAWRSISYDTVNSIDLEVAVFRMIQLVPLIWKLLTDKTKYSLAINCR